MDNENKEIDMTTQKVEPETVDFEFDPTASEEFYNNLEAAIGIGEDADVAGFPELLTEEDPFGADSVQLGEGYTEQEEELFAGVDAALTEQIEQEFGKEEASSSEEKTNKFMKVWKAI